MRLIRNTFASSINVTSTTDGGVTRNGVFKRRLRVIAINSVCFGRPFACYGHDNEQAFRRIRKESTTISKQPAGSEDLRDGL